MQKDGVCGGGDIGKSLPPPSPWRGYYGTHKNLLKNNKTNTLKSMCPIWVKGTSLY